MVTPSHRQHATAVTAAVCSSLSMVGTLYILARYWHARSAAAKAATSRHVSSLRRIDVTQELIHVLAWIDLLGAFARVFGPLPTMTFNQKNGEPVTDVCRLQAFVLSFSDVSAVMWNFLMAFNMFRWVCLGEDQQRLQQTIKWYILWTMAFTITITGTALGSGVYGNAIVWCWVSIPNDPRKELIWKLGTLYVWIILLAVAMAVLLLLVKLNVQRRLDGVDSADARVAYKRVIHNLTVYIVAFIVCWTPAVVNRAHSYITGDHSFVLEILHASVVSLQGFVNALIYGKLHVWIGRHVKHTSGSLKQLNRPPRPAALPEHQDPRRIGVATIFVTTFDMNWSPLPSNLRDWIPPNKGVYSISLLHCANIDEVRLVLHKYLEQVNFPMSFHLTTSATGLTSRGTASDASLIQLLFINKSDIASGNVQFPPSFGERKSANSGFKDAVGTPLRYFDASIAFVSCDLRNLSGNGSLKNKHMQVARFLRSFAMGADRSAVEFPSLYHHTILSSALSYSLDVPHDDLTDAVSNAYEKQCQRQRRDDMMQQRPLHRASISSDDQDATYDELYSSMENGVQFTQLQSPRGSDGADTSTQSTWSRERSWTQFLSAILPTPNTEAPPANNSRQDSTAMADRIVEAETAWRELTEHDELRQAMASQEVFCGFSEPSIEFLPTYPRLIGTGASYTLGVGNTMKNIFTGGSPEYSDRILTHSLPDTAQRLRRVTYAACEAIKSSSHKPVCSEFELEIDRFFAYVNSEVQRQDASVGATSLKDKSGVGEVKVTLKNLDVDLWATVAVNRNLRRSMHRLQRLRSSIMDKSLSPVGLRSPPIPESNRTVGDESPDVTNHVLSPEVFVSRRGTSEFDLEQIRVQPTRIATIFPLPSEDVYALQRKVYEVAHSVEKGFWASVEDGEGEEAILAYTNTRRTPWRGAVAHGVVHSAITKSVNGMFHIAVRVSGDSRDQYGQGILCIEESTLQQATTGVVVPFSIPLSCGGKHVGFLTGDVVM